MSEDHVLPSIVKIPGSFTVSSETYRMMTGQLTADELTQVDRHRAAKAAMVPAFVTAISQLDAIEDPARLVVLELHARTGSDYPECEGCDYAGFESEAPEWPCRTVEVVARQAGIAWPNWSMCDWRAVNKALAGDVA